MISWISSTHVRYAVSAIRIDSCGSMTSVCAARTARLSLSPADPSPDAPQSRFAASIPFDARSRRASFSWCRYLPTDRERSAVSHDVGPCRQALKFGEPSGQTAALAPVGQRRPSDQSSPPPISDDNSALSRSTIQIAEWFRASVEPISDVGSSEVRLLVGTKGCRRVPASRPPIGSPITVWVPACCCHTRSSICWICGTHRRRLLIKSSSSTTSSSSVGSTLSLEDAARGR